MIEVEVVAHHAVKSNVYFSMKKIELCAKRNADKKRSLSDLSLLLELSSVTALFILRHLHKVQSQGQKGTHTLIDIIIWRVGQNYSPAGGQPSNELLICNGVLMHKLACSGSFFARCTFLPKHGRLYSPTNLSSVRVVLLLIGVQEFGQAKVCDLHMLRSLH